MTRKNWRSRSALITRKEAYQQGLDHEKDGAQILASPIAPACPTQSAEDFSDENASG